MLSALPPLPAVTLECPASPPHLPGTPGPLLRPGAHRDPATLQHLRAAWQAGFGKRGSGLSWRLFVLV